MNTSDRYATPKVADLKCPEHPEAGVKRAPVPVSGPKGPTTEIRVFCRQCGKRVDQKTPE